MGKSCRKQCKKITGVKNKKYKKIAEQNQRARFETKQITTKHENVVGPNPSPPKEKVSLDDEKRKQRAKDIQQIQKAGRLKQQLKNRGVSDLAGEAKVRHEVFQYKTAVLPLAKDGSAQKGLKSYYREFKKVVDAADVILEVLDSRDPVGSRCPQVEQAVIAAGSGKRLVLVLNKIDLIPRDNLEQWLKYLRQELPTVAFKASTQAQNENLCQSKVAAIHVNKKLQSSRCCIGANLLMKVLGNYCRNENILTSIKVGVVGFPNVGKSSIINSLKRARTCVVGSTPGVTKNMQEIILDKHIKLLDSPGIVFAKEGSQSTLALRNAVKVETLKDVITPVEAIIQRASHQELMTHYCLPQFSSSQELLSLLAQKLGRFKKGGIPDPEAAARKLLNDWNIGKIKYYTHPPEVYEPSMYISAEVVQQMGKAFDISSLEEKMELDKVPTLFSNDGIQVQSDGPTEGIVRSDEDNMDMDHKSSRFPAGEVVVKFNAKKEAVSGETSKRVVPLELQQNRQRKKAFKQMKKKRKRNEKQAIDLSDTMDTALLL